MTLLNVFAENGNGNVDNHIGMQDDGDGEVTNGLEWTLWQANLGFVDIEALFGQCFCDIEIGDGTEQTAVHTGFLQDLDSQTSQFFTLGLGICQFFCRCRDCRDCRLYPTKLLAFFSPIFFRLSGKNQAECREV